MKKNVILVGLVAMSTLMFAQVPTVGLIGSWDFNSNLLDATSTGNHGSWKSGSGSTPTYVNDRCNNPNSALRLDGLSEYVEMKFAGPPNADARSLSFWMRTDNTTSGGQSVVRGIFNYGHYTTGNIGSRWEICHNYGCQGVGVDISYEYFTTKSSCVDNGKWHHIVATQNTGDQLNQTKIYIDGILMPAPSVEPVYPSGMPNCSPTSNTGVNATDIIAPNPQFKVITIGSVLGSLLPSLPQGVPGRFFDGDLDDFFLYERVLTSVEVAQLFAEQCELRPCTNCDEAAGNGEGDGDDEYGNPTDRKMATSSVQLSDKHLAVLDQNVPNPFAESTTITYNIPEDFTKAQLHFVTTNGKLIKVVDILEKGKGAVNVLGNDLSRGVYAYKLVIDGTTIDTKKIIKE